MFSFVGAQDAICRGVKTSTDEWIYGYFIHRNLQPYIAVQDEFDAININDDSTIIKAYPVFEDSVGLFSFELDKNGNEIYEGDFIKTTIGPGSPFQTELIALVTFDAGTFFAGGFIELEKEDFKYCEIIGNKYDNPEILDLIPIELAREQEYE